ncbi:MAG: hypothetical protein DRJ61_15250 [Acidobacteria bacterium]|nr:MAG: hypothetical protein DRJ61_15250 [Acidobacteriota bacterium]
MRAIFLSAIITMTAVLPSQAVEFLGVELCTNSMSTSVVLPEGSPLILESVEVGDQGALVLLLGSDDTTILDQIDDLMTGFTGNRGVGNEKSLQWSGRQITAFAQVLKPKLAALAVTTSDECRDDKEVVMPAEAQVAPVVPALEAVPVAAVALVPMVSVLTAPSADQPEPTVDQEGDFTLEGALKHEAFSDDWVDVMGVVVNNTGEAYNLATFDLSLWDLAGRLICVDTISVSVLKGGQHRAFRDSIQCPGYSADAVVRSELQFAGGH